MFCIITFLHIISGMGQFHITFNRFETQQQQYSYNVFVRSAWQVEICFSGEGWYMQYE
jgi:hypothetical protein